MPEEIYRVIIPLVIALLIIWLIYRIKNRIRTIVKNEIYDNFPTIKDKIADFEHRVEYLKTQIDILERKIKELQRRTT